MAEIRFEGVAKGFGAVKVIDNLNLTIADGEFFTFVGPSGCGKSTLLNLIAGLDDIQHGVIRFDGRAINELAPGERDVAMVFQSYALYPHLTVFDNLAFPLKIRKQRQCDIARQVTAVARTLGLEDLLGRKPRELSGGQRQRVALGRALIRRPRVFLMDEPLSNLDARLRLEMRAELKRLHGEYRITTVYVTHDQEEALALSGRIAVLDRGRIQQCGTPEDVYADPANLFVAGFIGSPPMNMVDAALLMTVPGLRPAVATVGARRTVAGVRPSEIGVEARCDGPGLPAEVLLLEPTGSDLWVTGCWQDQRIKGRAAPGQVIVQGATACFKISPEKIFLFDQATGNRIG